MEAVNLRRGLFGYSPRAVRELFLNREQMFSLLKERLERVEGERSRAQAQARAHQEEVQTLRAQARSHQEEVQTLRAQAQAHQEEVRSLETEIDAGAERLAAAEARALQLQAELEAARGEGDERAELAAPGPVPSEFAPVIRAVEDAMARWKERADVTGRDKLHRAERLQEEAHGILERVTDWRERVAEALPTLEHTITESLASIEEAPERLRQLLIPLGDSFQSVNEGLAQLAAMVKEAPNQHVDPEVAHDRPPDPSVSEVEAAEDIGTAEAIPDRPPLPVDRHGGADEPDADDVADPGGPAWFGRWRGHTE